MPSAKSARALGAHARAVPDLAAIPGQVPDLTLLRDIHVLRLSQDPLAVCAARTHRTRLRRLRSRTQKPRTTPKENRRLIMVEAARWVSLRRLRSRNERRHLVVAAVTQR